MVSTIQKAAFAIYNDIEVSKLEFDKTHHINEVILL